MHKPYNRIPLFLAIKPGRIISARIRFASEFLKRNLVNIYGVLFSSNNFEFVKTCCELLKFMSETYLLNSYLRAPK